MARRFEVVRRPFQPDASVTEETLAAFERARELPELYRRFLLETNGGSIQPYVLDLVVPGEHERVHAIECLHDWAEVLDRSQLDIAPELRNVPPDRLAIGDTTCELEIMLSIERSRFGAIDVWVKDLDNTWGEGANTTVVPLATSFEAFLDLVRVDRGDETYHSFWSWLASRASEVDPRWFEVGP